MEAEEGALTLRFRQRQAFTQQSLPMRPSLSSSI